MVFFFHDINKVFFAIDCRNNRPGWKTRHCANRQKLIWFLINYFVHHLLLRLETWKPYVGLSWNIGCRASRTLPIYQFCSSSTVYRVLFDSKPWHEGRFWKSGNSMQRRAGWWRVGHNPAVGVICFPCSITKLYKYITYAYTWSGSLFVGSCVVQAPIWQKSKKEEDRWWWNSLNHIWD